MSAKDSAAKENVRGRQVDGGKSRNPCHSDEAGETLWTNEEGMKKYIAKLKQELSEQRLKIRRVHQDKADEIKRLHDSFDQDKLKAIASMSKKMEQDKTYELNKLRDSVCREKESELREILRAKDEELRALKNELQETKANNKIIEFENKRLLGDRLKGEANDHTRRLKAEISVLKQDKKNLEDSLRIKTESDFAKAEEIRKIRHEYDMEIQRLTRDAKRDSFREFQHLKSVSKQIEVKNHELATKEAVLHRLEEQKQSLDNNLISQRKSEPSSPHKKKSESNFDKMADEKIKKLKMRNSELVNIARKLEEKAKRLQEEKDIIEKSTGSSAEVGQLKKAFTRQRAKDLAEHAKLLMKKDCEIDELKKGVQHGNNDVLNKIEDVVELRNIVEKNAKERLVLEKQLATTKQKLSEEIRDLHEQNARMSRNNEMLKEELAKLQDIEAKHYEIVFEMNQLCNERNKLAAEGVEKDEEISKLETLKQQVINENQILHQEKDELSGKIHKLEKLQEECRLLNDNVQYLKNENELLTSENEKLRAQIEQSAELEGQVVKLRQENTSLVKENENCVMELKQRNSDIASLHTAQREAQKKHEEQVSGLEEMIERLRGQHVSTTPLKDSTETPPYMLNSTPKDSKFTQTSRPSSPALSPIRDECAENTIETKQVKSLEVDGLSEHSVTSCVPADIDDASSASFDLEKAANRIDQLAASDSDVDGAQDKRSGTESVYSSDLSSSHRGCDDDDDDGRSVGSCDTSYSADISQTTDHEEGIVDEARDFDAGVFIGSPSPDVLDINEKLSIFIAKYSYDPLLYSPNENPEVELAFQAGDYLYVYGDVDEDGFFVGELMNGDRGLVPSNFIERIADDEAILKEDTHNDNTHETGDDYEYSEEESSEEELLTLRDEDGKRKVIRPKAFSERRHEMFRTSLDHVLTDQLADIRESDEEELSSAASDDWTSKQRRNDRTEADQNIGEGHVSTESEDIPQRVFSPTKLSLDRQFTSSALVSWEAASQMLPEQIYGYNIYVNGKFKTQVRGTNKTNVLVEDVYPDETYRVSVRTKSVDGRESSDKEATIVFGPDAKLSVYDLTVSDVTETSAMVTWTPANSCYAHAIHLGESLLTVLKPTISSYTLSELTPSTQYHVLVKTQLPNGIQLPLHSETSHAIHHTSELEFTTLCGGLPDPPLNLSLDRQTAEWLTFTWLPVTISQAGHSNGFTVTNYKIYVNGVYCAETDTADIDSVAVSKERLAELGKRHDLTRMRFVARTQSVLGESVDSNIVELVNAEDGTSSLVLQETAVQNSTMPTVSSSVEDAESGPVCSEKGTTFSEDGAGISDNVVDDSTFELFPQSHIHEDTRQIDKSEIDSIITEDATPTSGQDTEVSGTATMISEDIAAISEKDNFRPEGASIDQATVNSAAEATVNSSAEIASEVVPEGATTHHEDATVISEDGPTYRSADVPETTGNDSEANTGEESQIESSDDNRTMRAEHEIGVVEGTLDVVRDGVVNGPSGSESCTAESITETEDEVVEIFARANEPVQDDIHTQRNPVPVEGSPTFTPEEVKCDGEEVPSAQEGVVQLDNVSTGSDTEADFDEVLSVIEEVKCDGEVPSAQEGVVQLDNVSTGSDTEADFDEVLSVIQEVDEENLTVSESTTAAESRDEQGGSTLHEEHTNTDTLRSSIISDSGTKPISSDDDGFRTEDDVLDLLDDDEVTRVIVMANDIIEGNPASTPRENHVASEVTPSGNNALLSSNSSDNLSHSSRPTTNSVTSESLSSTSEAPPPPDDAENAILDMLSLPDRRESADTNLPHGSVSEGDDVLSHNTGTPSGAADLVSEDIDVASQDTDVVSGDADSASDPVRYFIALYEYDPIKMSPNDDGADEELAFKEGDLIKVFGEKDGDGFFWGESKNKQGFVPSNMVSEITLEEAEDLYNEPSFDDLSLDQIPNIDTEMDVDITIRHDVTPETVSSVNDRARNRLSFWDRTDSMEFEARKMRAKFDYDPVKDSPNVDREIELMFKTGDIIYVFGDMDDDGFFQGELDGMRGLVPSNFLEHVQTSSDSSTTHLSSLPPSTSSSTEYLQDIHESSVLPNGTQKGGQTKKKKGLFSKGKKIFKKAFR